ncbi:MAG: DUF1684 domain-containing protein [Gemmatimonadetes bacterium]|nr:DUF1684 domain-containing protein [Gemmatimonadota bacterium]MDA1103516.1 DUF1684 domain-containing protein [Gemmatimonadota bacterium]
MRAFARLGALAIVFAGCGEGPPESIPTDEAAHAVGVRRFHEARVAELAAPDSWLSLIALHWLPEGETTLGSDPASDLVLPAAKAAPVVGRVVRAGSSVRFVAEPGVRVTMGIDSTLSLTAGSGAFPPDDTRDPIITDEALGEAGPGKSIVFRHGPINWILVSRGGEFALRVRDNEHPAYADFTGIERYPIAAEWRVTARWVPHEKTVLVPDVLGGSSETDSPAHLEFWVDGERHQLDVTGSPDAERFMMVFADGTTGRGSYGGGRYVWFDAPDADRRVVIDFNRAYNPPCVWTGYATCPLPTRDNRLDLAIEAGEMDWKH